MLAQHLNNNSSSSRWRRPAAQGWAQRGPAVRRPRCRSALAPWRQWPPRRWRHHAPTWTCGGSGGARECVGEGVGGGWERRIQGRGLYGGPGPGIISMKGGLVLHRNQHIDLRSSACAQPHSALCPCPPAPCPLVCSVCHSSSPEGSGGGASLELGDAWAAWAAHRRHVFVLTSAGKPVYSLHGDEGALAGEGGRAGLGSKRTRKRHPSSAC